MVNQQFQVAVHIMAALAFRGRMMDSRTIAISVRTNPVVVRRLVSALRRARLVETVCGRSGGIRLARPANRISLLDIYDAIELGPAFGVSERPVARRCPISCNMNRVLAAVSVDAERALRAQLGRISMARVALDIARSARSSHRGAG